MAITFVGSTPAVGANNGGDVTLSFSNLRDAAGATPTLQEGDLVVVAYMSSGTADAACSTSSSNWNELFENYANGTSNDTNLAVYWKVMTASPDTQFVAVGPTGNSNATVAVAFAFRGVDTSSPIDVFTSGSHAATGTATGRPNPAVITPATAGSWIVVVGAAAAATGATFTNPGDLSSTTNHYRALSHAETIDGMLGMGLKTNWSSGAFDPAQWTSGPNNAGDSWAAMTLALKPAPPVATCTPVDALQGQTAEQPAMAAAVATAANDAAQGQAVDAPTVAPIFVVAVNDAAQAQSEDAAAATAIAAAVPADAFQGQQEDQPSLTPATATSAADMEQAQGVDQPSVAFSIPAVADDALQPQSADVAPAVSVAVTAPVGALQGQSADQAAATPLAPASPSDAFQGQGTDMPAMAAMASATVADAVQAQQTDAAPASSEVAVVPSDAVQAQGEDTSSAVGSGNAAPHDAAQAQAGASPSIAGSGTGAAAPEDLAQAASIGAPSVMPMAQITVHGAFQLQAMDYASVTYRGAFVTPPARSVSPARPSRAVAGTIGPSRTVTPASPSRHIAPNLQPRGTGE